MRGSALLALLVLSCAGPRPPPREGPAATSAALRAARPARWALDDRAALARLTRDLGAPLPPEASEEPITLDDARVRLPDLALFGGVRRAGRAHRGRLHTVELTFPGACLPACVGRVRAALDDWLGPPSAAREGNAFFFHYTFDTTRVTFEHYPRKPAFSRVVLSCEPLAAFARGRPEGLRPRRRGAAAGPLPRCRAVPSRANPSG